MDNLNKYLFKVVRRSIICKNCTFNHNGICFFAYACIKDNFKFYKEEKKHG